MEKEYIKLLKHVLTHGKKHNDRTNTGTLRVFGVMTKYDLSKGFPLLTTKKMNLRLIAEELIWMLSGSTNNHDLQKKNVHIWDGNSSFEECLKFNREEGDLGPIYGHQWRNFNASRKKEPLENDYYSANNLRYVNKAFNDDGIDQIKNIIEQIKNNPNSRRIIVNSWNPSEVNEVNPPPCHSFFQIMIEDNKINLALTQRSCDLFLGCPFNIAFYSLIIHLLAKVCNLEVGTFTHFIGDAHIYLDHIKQCEEQVNRTIYKTPQITISDKLKGQGLIGLLDFNFKDHIQLHNYSSHPALKGKMSV